ncbi:MAG TPA: hypothetical protein VGN46_19480 [Luteibacter sp.]|jgi:hypothetical protein|uniref:hypothetical protein n=1 Tax=Luteibacter sp. TaxID=1886636 RepID=UPI002F42E827
MVANPDIDPHTHQIPDLRLAKEVDCVVVGLTGDDNRARLRLRDYRNRFIDVRVDNADLIRELRPHLNMGRLRVLVDGPWERRTSYWFPKRGVCYARSFVKLKTTDIAEILDRITQVAADGWNSLDDPMATWKEWRGCA